MNDDWRAALEYDCDGVHLGPDDDGFARAGAVRAAMRERLDRPLVRHARRSARRQRKRASIISAVGPVFATTSKDGRRRADRASKALRASPSASAVPVAAIGGISHRGSPRCADAGVAMAAVISAVANAPTHIALPQQLVSALELR